jgi:hypothetical protein
VLVPPADVVTVSDEEPRRIAITNREKAETCLISNSQLSKRRAAALNDLNRKFIGQKHSSCFYEKPGSLKAQQNNSPAEPPSHSS